MSFRDCLDAALKEGLISREDHERLVERHTQLSRDDPSNARRLLADEETARAANARRSKLLQVKAQDTLWTDVTGAARLRADRNMGQDLEAILNGSFENITGAGMLSARGISSRLLGGSINEMAELLLKFRRSRITQLRGNRPLLDDVARAGFGANVSEEAKAFYGSFRTVAEKLRHLYNEAGGRIGWREDWGLPQWHNPSALIRAGKARWIAGIENKIDWDKMNLEAVHPILPGERRAVLERIFETVTQDGWNTRQLEGGGGERSFANRRVDHRFLVFKTADDWLDYSREFGAGEPFGVMMKHIVSMTRDIALMQRFGPNPGATVEWMKALLQREAAKFTAGEPSLFFDAASGAWTRRGAAGKARAAARTLDGFFEHAKGGSAPRSPIGDVVQIVGNDQYSALMGSSVLTDLAANPVVQMQMRYLHDLPMMRMARDTLGNLKDPAEALQAEMIIDGVLHTMERGAREDYALRKAAEFTNWLPKLTTNYSGLDALSEAMRTSAMQAQQAQAANYLKFDWAALPARYKDMLRGYAIDAKDWAVMRRATPDEPKPGARFLRPRDVAALGQESELAATKYGAMLHQMIEVQAPQSSWRSGAFASAHGLQDPATLAGFVYKSAAMFKAGWLATFAITQWSVAARDIRINGWSAGKWIALYAPMMMMMGTLAYQFRQLGQGKDLAPIDPTTKEGRVTYARGLVTSGGMILLGDFIKAETSAYGHGFGATLAGPLVEAGITAADTLGAPLKAAYDLAFGDPSKWSPGASAVKILRGNTPLLSTHWALRAAYNRMILDQLQFMADPAAHSKMRRAEQKLKRETGQGFFWRPGEVAPERLPELAR